MNFHSILGYIWWQTLILKMMSIRKSTLRSSWLVSTVSFRLEWRRKVEHNLPLHRKSFFSWNQYDHRPIIFGEACKDQWITDGTANMGYRRARTVPSTQQNLLSWIPWCISHIWPCIEKNIRWAFSLDSRTKGESCGKCSNYHFIEVLLLLGNKCDVKDQKVTVNEAL